MNGELRDVQAEFRKGRGMQNSSCQHPLNHRKKSREFQKSIYFCFTNYAKAFDCVDHTNWKILKQMGIPDRLTCLLRNLYVHQKATVRTGHGRMDLFKIGKGE